MIKLCMVQLQKVFLRNDVKCVLTFFLLAPISIAFLISIESGIIQIGDSVFTAMGYVTVVIGLMKSLLLVSVSVALITTLVVSKEIDIGLDSMYLAKVSGRRQLIISKIVSIDILVFLIFLVLFTSAVFGWMIFLKNSSFGSDIFFVDDADISLYLIVTVISAFFETLMMASLFTLFSILFKYGKAIVCAFLSIVILKLFANIEFVKEWIPAYLGDGANLMGLDGDELISRGIMNLCILIVYTTVLVIADCIIYRKIDFSR